MTFALTLYGSGFQVLFVQNFVLILVKELKYFFIWDNSFKIFLRETICLLSVWTFDELVTFSVFPCYFLISFFIYSHKYSHKYSFSGTKNGYSVKDSFLYDRFVHSKNKQLLLPGFSLNRLFD